MRLPLRFEMIEWKIIPEVELMTPPAILSDSPGMQSVGISQLYFTDGSSGKKQISVVHPP